MHITINLALLIAGFLQSVVLFTLVWNKSRSSQQARIYFLFFLVVLTIQIILKGLSKIWIISNFGFLSILAYELPFLYGPLAWLYTRNVIGQPGNWKKNIVHFIPFGIFLLLLVIFIMIPENKTIISLLPNTVPKRIIHAVLMGLSLICYYISSRNLIHRHRKFASGLSADFDSVQLPWLGQFNKASLATGLIIVIALELMYNYFPALTEIRYLFLALTCIIYWMVYKMISTPAIFNFERLVTLKTEKKFPGRAKYQKSSFKPGEDRLIIDKLIFWLEQSKAYTDPNCTLERISQQTGISRHNISQAINTGLQKTYYDLINEYRVKHAVSLLEDPTMDHLTIAAIARASGFNSASGFNTIFKKNTGATPAQWKKNSRINGSDRCIITPISPNPSV